MKLNVHTQATLDSIDKITRIEDVDRKQWYMIIYIETGRT